MNDVWHKGNIFWREQSILQTKHGRILNEMVKNIRHFKTIDLGSGDQGAKEIFPNYTGVDLPDFDVYVDDLTFLRKYDLVLMNAFIDVMQFPEDVLERVLNHCKGIVVIHRQELTWDATTISQEPAYGGWTYHSKLDWAKFLGIYNRKGFTAVKVKALDFDNWEDGGWSIILKKL